MEGSEDDSEGCLELSSESGFLGGCLGDLLGDLLLGTAPKLPWSGFFSEVGSQLWSANKLSKPAKMTCRMLQL